MVSMVEENDVRYVSGGITFDTSTRIDGIRHLVRIGGAEQLLLLLGLDLQVLVLLQVGDLLLQIRRWSDSALRYRRSRR